MAQSLGSLGLEVCGVLVQVLTNHHGAFAIFPMADQKDPVKTAHIFLNLFLILYSVKPRLYS